MQGEFHLIEKLKSLIPRFLQGPFGIGDDAAILPTGAGKSFLFTTDTLVEGIDFLTGRKGPAPEAVGHKALAVNLSDIAAMGGRPTAFVVAWGIPRKYSEDWVERAAKGMIRLARQFHVLWVGGDISRSSRLFISIALLGEGETKKIVQRKGARPGNLVYVTGRLGGSILRKHLTFDPRLAEAQYLAGRFHPTAMIDISDGFIQDLEHVLTSSRVSARIELDRIPVSNDAWKKSRGSRRRALKSALTDGEDFELLFTLPPSEGNRLENAWRRRFPSLALARVGAIQRRVGKIEWRERGKKVQLWFRKKGFLHF